MADAFDLLERNVDRLISKVDVLVTEVSEIKITLARIITQISFAKWFAVTAGGAAVVSVATLILNIIINSLKTTPIGG